MDEQLPTDIDASIVNEPQRTDQLPTTSVEASFEPTTTLLNTAMTPTRPSNIKVFVQKNIKRITLGSLLILLVTTTAAAFFTPNFFKISLPSVQHDINKEVTASPTPTPTPLPTASVSGTIKDDFWNTPLSNITITLENTTTHASASAQANAKGEFVFTDIEIGSYNLSASSATHTVPTSEVTISEAANEHALLASMTNPKNSQVSGIVYKDNNKNGKYESDEPSMRGVIGVYREEKKEWKLFKDLTSDDGKFSVSLARGKYRIIPGGATFFIKPEEVTITVDGYGKAISKTFGYTPTVAEGGFKIYAFNDKNENSSRDGDEELIHYQAVRVTNKTTGESAGYVVPVDGTEVTHLSYGNYFITLYPETPSWDAYYKRTDPGHFIDLNSSETITLYLGVHKL